MIMTTCSFASIILGVILLGISNFCSPAQMQTRGGLPNFEWKVVAKSPLDDGPSLGQVHFFSDTEGVAITLTGFTGTRDGGRSWNLIRDLRESLLSSFVVHDQDVWIVGGRFVDGGDKIVPFVSRANRDGTNWADLKIRDQVPGGDKIRSTRFNDACFDKNGKLWLAGEGEIIQVEVWSDIKIANVFQVNRSIKRVFCGGSEIWAFGGSGSVGRFSEGEWRFLNLGMEKSFNRMTLNGNRLWLVGSSTSSNAHGKAVLLSSDDGGLVWKEKPLSMASSLTDITFLGNRGWLAGIKGQIFSTVDAGESWSREEPRTQDNLYSIFFVDPEKGWAVGDHGVVLSFSRAEAL